MFLCFFVSFFFFLVSSSAAFFFSTPTYTYILIHGKEFRDDWINCSTQMLFFVRFSIIQISRLAENIAENKILVQFS